MGVWSTVGGPLGDSGFKLMALLLRLMSTIRRLLFELYILIAQVMAAVVDFVRGLAHLDKIVHFETTKLKVKVKGKKHIGEGAYSMVYKAYQQYDKSKQFALKRMLVQSEEAEKLIQVEVDAFNRFKHPNILTMIDTTSQMESGLKAVYLLFPLIRNGSLRDILTEVGTGKRPRPSVSEVLSRFTEVCNAFNVLHQYKPAYVHQDIKPENVLISDDGTPLLTDFGSVRHAEVHVKTHRDGLNIADQASQLCTAPYRAPELYNPETGSRLDTRTDVWGIGCLLFAWWFGYSPYECEFHGPNLRVVECSSLRVLSPIPRPAKPTAEDTVILELCEWILVINFTQRPFTSDILARVAETLENLRAEGKAPV